MAYIIGVGSYSPSKILTNKDLEGIVETSDEWITTRTGIKERHIAAGSEITSDLAHKAALEAIRDAGICADQIDMIICATITPDMPFPSTACFVQRKIGIKDCACMDISAACSGFIYGLEIASALIDVGAHSHVLVIGAEKLSSIVDWKDRNTCVLFGDGAGAAVVSASVSGHKIVATYTGADGGCTGLLYQPAGGSAMPASHETVDSRMHYLKMSGKEVFKHAVNAMVKSVEKVLEKARVPSESISYFIPHQANMRIISAIAERLSVPSERLYVNVQSYGNTSAASTIIALDEMHRSKMLKKGDRIVLVAFGGGLTWGASLIEW